jgi:hypothetical protein
MQANWTPGDWAGIVGIASALMAGNAWIVNALINKSMAPLVDRVSSHDTQLEVIEVKVEATEKRLSTIETYGCRHRREHVQRLREQIEEG